MYPSIVGGLVLGWLIVGRSRSKIVEDMVDFGIHVFFVLLFHFSYLVLIRYRVCVLNLIDVHNYVESVGADGG